jgi:hypothetical protein
MYREPVHEGIVDCGQGYSVLPQPRCEVTTEVSILIDGPFRMPLLAEIVLKLIDPLI